MQANVTMQGDEKVIAVEGRIDTTTAPEFEKVMVSELEEGKNVKVDLQNVAYVSSAGLRVFLNSQKISMKKGIEMTLVNVTENVMEVFEITGFADILNIQ